jgi:hypothetical protein
MNLLAHTISGLEAVLLPLASALLLEELTFGGLVRLLLAPRPETGRREAPARQVFVAGVQTQKEPNNHEGGGK